MPLPFFSFPAPRAFVPRIPSASPCGLLTEGSLDGPSRERFSRRTMQQDVALIPGKRYPGNSRKPCSRRKTHGFSRS